jgi:hypothetical protein
MIGIVSQLVACLAGGKNTRGGLVTTYNQEGRTPQNYIDLVCGAIKKLPKTSSGGIKSTVAIYFDRHEPIMGQKKKFDQEVSECLKARGYSLVENVTCSVDSSNHSPGIIYTDILAHVSRWVIENPTSIELNLFDLFEGKPTTTRKINVAHDIFNLLKTKVVHQI